ncbi:MAG: flavin reductase family protein [Phascolarctobacterium sp.]|nr:flavin reductase family protein [Phascolarctobacterium sp.]
MQEINVFEHAEAILKQLSKGAFLNTAANGTQNTMTIGWGQLGFQWGVPTFAVMVRESRYTKGLLDENAVFTVSIPVNDGFQKALGICGSKSGRDMDKFEAAGLETEMGKTVFAPIVKGCGLQIECEVVETKVMEPEQFDGEMADKWYAAGDWHTYYVGKITAAYLE